MTFTNINEITEKYNYFKPSEADKTHELQILEIFNTQIPDDIRLEKYYDNGILLNWIARYYYNVFQNISLAIKYYLMAIEHGSLDAMNSLGCYYDDIEKNYELAVKYYLMAIEHGNVAAMNSLGVYYYDIEKNYELAVKYYLMAIEHGNVDAMDNLCLYYDEVEKNYELAVKYYLMAIEHCSVDAMLNLGVYYHNIEKNYELAVKYYLMAAENNNYEAYIKLGSLYHEKDDINNALKYYLKYMELQMELHDSICEFVNNNLSINIIDLLINYSEKQPNVITLFDNPRTKYLWHILEKELNIISAKCMQHIDIKLKQFGKIQECNICLMDNIQCIPFNWCMHYTCVDCYQKLCYKPCPFCRLP